VARISDDKGIDLLVAALPDLIDRGLRVAFLGDGDPGLSRKLYDAHRAAPDRIGLRLGRDEQLAHRIQAGADMFLVPSRYEPCGLTQLYALRYGTLPIVRNTGGLANTVTEGPAGNGIVFDDATVESLVAGVDRALALFADRPAFAATQARGMRQDFSWATAARRYAELYAGILCDA